MKTRLILLKVAVCVMICLIFYHLSDSIEEGIEIVIPRRSLRDAVISYKLWNHEEKGGNSESPSPSPSVLSRLSPSPTPVSSASPVSSPTNSLISPTDTPSIEPIPTFPTSSTGSSNHYLIIIGAIGTCVAVFISLVGVILWRSNSRAPVNPWITLSGQLQRRFITGVPKLKRSELETACEDFCNVIGSTSCGTVFKGTLSSGVEIAVVSIQSSINQWGKGIENMFRRKIDTLSKINHKNFVNLLGFCEESQPFTRMMIFEYAPNGTLYEHLHCDESEPLDWRTRMRIAMGVAYCLEHMHQLEPPIAHNDLNSSVINLAEDYAAKVSDFCFKRERVSLCSDELGFLKVQSVSMERDVYRFGVMLLEMITGAVPYDDERFVEEYLERRRPVLVDRSLRSCSEEEIDGVGDLIAGCVDRNPNRRPLMREVVVRMREITGIGPDGAVPKISPLWWAELEILSVESS